MNVMKENESTKTLVRRAQDARSYLDRKDVRSRQRLPVRLQICMVDGFLRAQRLIVACKVRTYVDTARALGYHPSSESR